MVDDAKEKGLVAVVEDKLLEGAALEATIQKLDSDVSVVGLSWLSSCIEHNKRVSEVPFMLRRMSGGVAGGDLAKRSVHNMSESDESETEGGQEQFSGKLKHRLSDSDNEDSVKAAKKSSPDETGNSSGEGNGSSGSPNANIAAELGEKQHLLGFAFQFLQLKSSPFVAGKLAKAYTASGDQWRARTYLRAVKTISALDIPITTR